MRKLSDAGLDLLRGFEGLRLTSYQDDAEVWTIGYGHTKDVHPGQTITLEQAKEFLAGDVEWAETCVNLRAAGVNQNEFDALVCLVYNLGCTKFNSSTLLRMLRVGDKKAAASHFTDFVYSGGKFSQGLKNRRERERDLFLTPAPADFSNVQSGVESTAPGDAEYPDSVKQANGN